MTNYCIDNLGIKATPIGLHGPKIMIIDKVNNDELIKNLYHNTAKRTAYIVKEFADTVIQVINLLGNRANMIKDENCHIKDEKINFFTIRNAKGLEFDRVFVDNEGMTKNERYIAYTRTLEELIIIN